MNTIARPTRAADAPVLARIYSQGIAEWVATFETEPRNADRILELLLGPAH